MTEKDRELKVALIHAVEGARQASAPRFEAAGFDVVNLLDEALLPLAQAHGGVDAECSERMATLVRLAAQAGVDAVVTTCNAYSGAVAEIAAGYPELPVLSIDTELVRHAVLGASRIGLIGTVAVGLARQQEYAQELADELGRAVTFVPLLLPAALTALQAGDTATHDRLIAEAAEAFADVDVVVLTQASMAGAADLVAEHGFARVPVLASPQLMVNHLVTLLEPGRDGGRGGR